MRLTEDELREVFARAEELQGLVPGAGLSTELEAVIEAGEQVGLGRPAMERALRERLEFMTSPPAEGTQVFALSADGKFYAAEVVSSGAEGVRVRFLQGSEHVVTLDQLRPFSLIPGMRVVCNWPWWGPWTCTVVAYDSARRRVKLNDGWGSTKSFPAAEVWLSRPRRASRTRAALYAKLLGAGAGIGALIGTIVTALALG